MSSDSDRAKEAIVFDIKVTDPEVAHVTSFSTKHVNYKITSVSNLPEIRGDASGTVEISVIRRYRDFQWLSLTLSSVFPGAVIPPLPVKTTVSNKALEMATSVLSSAEELDGEYVEARRMGLEKFLVLISKHPELHASAAVFAFVKAAEDEFKKAKEELRPKSVTASVVDVFSSSLFSITTGAMKSEPEKTEHDVKVDDMVDYIGKLEAVITKLRGHAAAKLQHLEESGKAVNEISSTFKQFENLESHTFSSALQEVATSSLEPLVELIKQSCIKEALTIIEPLEQILGFIVCIRTAISIRKEKLSEYTQAAQTHESKQASYGSTMNSMFSSNVPIGVYREAAEKAKEEFDTATARLLRDFERFQIYKAYELQSALVGLANLEVAFNQGAGDLWKKAVPVLEKTI